jgi:hypothetical protein
MSTNTDHSFQSREFKEKSIAQRRLFYEAMQLFVSSISAAARLDPIRGCQTGERHRAVIAYIAQVARLLAFRRSIFSF